MTTDHSLHFVFPVRGCPQCYPEYEALLRERDERIRKLEEALDEIAFTDTSMREPDYPYLLGVVKAKAAVAIGKMEPDALGEG